MSVSDFWEHDPEEVLAVVEAHRRRLQDEDDTLAHYAALQLSVHIEKKSDRPAAKKLKRLLPRHPEPTDEGDDAPRQPTAEERRDAFKKLKEHRRRQNRAS